MKISDYFCLAQIDKSKRKILISQTFLSPGRSFQFAADADVDLHGLQGPLLLWLDALQQHGSVTRSEYNLCTSAFPTGSGLNKPHLLVFE